MRPIIKFRIKSDADVPIIANKHTNNSLFTPVSYELHDQNILSSRARPM